ncbi:CAP domain-containing protein [Microlunatus elymi]|uniref:CAP domain-containing protein n=1 Tax=Microlunatus elymi TaxID=2596828 RepID=A0A516PZM4_9ACTN|nr:CAP domain-containing protein [Microlunatus elymi]QDP96431.1 CAP domain-containing protein [Microlunatus elymi]
MTRSSRFASAGAGRKVVVGFVTTVLMGATAVLGGPLAPAEAASMGHDYEQSVARLTNHERTKRGLVKLSWGSCLDRYAEAQATWMAKHQKLHHQDLHPILRACDLTWVGENIAVGYPTPAAVTKAWMKSPGHRENILRKQYRRYGLGAYKDSHGRWWVSHVFGRH